MKKEKKKKVIKVDTTVIKVTCPYCGVEFDADMSLELENSAGCETCGYGSGAHGSINIYCASCGRLVYSKEVDTAYQS